MARLSLITLIVEDYDTAIEFFVNKLSFDLVSDKPATTNDGRPKRWVVVKPAKAETGILLAQADGEHQSAMIGEQMTGRIGFFLEVDDFDASYKELQDTGVEFATGPVEETYGIYAVFRDVVGNKSDLIQSI